MQVLNALFSLVRFFFSIPAAQIVIPSHSNDNYNCYTVMISLINIKKYMQLTKGKKYD